MLRLLTASTLILALCAPTSTFAKPKAGRSRKARKTGKVGKVVKAGPSKEAKAKAGALFKSGQALYNSGRFDEAIKAFTEAHRLAPHPSTLFNIARCHENLGKPQRALGFYRKALAATTEKSTRQDLQARISRLARFPGKIFVSSQPPGANITVDGRGKPERKTTPMLVEVPAGGHVLLFRKEGYLLAAKHVDVGVGGERTVHLVLQKKPEKPKPCKVCPPIPHCPKCRDPGLLEFKGLHLHVAIFGGFAVASELGAVGGPGVQATATIGRWRIGAHFQYLPVNPSAVAKLAGTDLRNSFMQGQLEGGWTFPFGRFHFYTTAGVGLYLDRVVEQPQGDQVASKATETGGVIWSVGGGIEVMATGWLSLGIGLRAGLMHGSLLDTREVPDPQTAGATKIDTFDVDGPFPIATLWGAVNIHL